MELKEDIRVANKTQRAGGEVPRSAHRGRVISVQVDAEDVCSGRPARRVWIPVCRAAQSIGLSERPFALSAPARVRVQRERIRRRRRDRERDGSRLAGGAGEIGQRHCSAVVAVGEAVGAGIQTNCHVGRQCGSQCARTGSDGDPGLVGANTPVEAGGATVSEGVCLAGGVERPTHRASRVQPGCGIEAHAVTGADSESHRGCARTETAEVHTGSTATPPPGARSRRIVEAVVVAGRRVAEIVQILGVA